MLRLEVHATKAANTGFTWHARSGNGQITTAAESYTRHEDAVRALRRHVEEMAELLWPDPSSFISLEADRLFYYDAKLVKGKTLYTKKQLYG